MKNTFFDQKWTYVFKFDEWVEDHKPSQIRSSSFWDEVHLEYDKILEEFKTLLNSKEIITDSEGNTLSQIEIYNLIDKYKIRMEKLMLIFNLKIYITLNENKKTGIKYVVIRVNWIDHMGKYVRWFSKNLGPESKVKVEGNIPLHFIESAEDHLLFNMWDQYKFEYLSGLSNTSFDEILSI
jgi:hypothetical protein